MCDSALNAMLVNELFADTELSEEDKQRLLPAMLFADLPAAIETAGRDGFWDMVDAVLWDAMGVDLYGTRLPVPRSPCSTGTRTPGASAPRCCRRTASTGTPLPAP